MASLVDGERLAALMIDHNVGVSDRDTYTVKRVDSDYFGDEA
jgi:restriction system protein